MQDATWQIVKATLKADGTLTTADRARMLSLIRTGDTPTKQPDKPRIMRRAEVAAALGRSVRGIDLLAEQGIIEKVLFPGRVRAAGFRESDVLALING